MILWKEVKCVMLPEYYAFFEQYDGVSYDFNEDLQTLKDVTFIEPYRWNELKDNILENLQDALDCITKNARYLGEDMPSEKDFKKDVATFVLAHLVDNLNYIKQNLSIEKTDISSFEELENQLYVVGELIMMLTTNSLDDLLKDDLFNTYLIEDEDDDNPFVTVLGLHERDVPNLFMTVQSIREDYFASLEDDE